MSNLHKRKPAAEPRLLIKTDAAAYCGVSLGVFDKACPVQPVRLLDRIPRYDRFALDRWIDSLDNSIKEEEISLSELWDERDSNSHART